MGKPMCVYILANRNESVLYTGVTNDLRRRLDEHAAKIGGQFTSSYNCVKLLWYEVHDDPMAAISREKQIKGGSRAKKEALIEAQNPMWIDLREEIEEGDHPTRGR